MRIRAHLHTTVHSRARASLRHARLSRARASLRHARLSRARAGGWQLYRLVAAGAYDCIKYYEKARDKGEMTKLQDSAHACYYSSYK